MVRIRLTCNCHDRRVIAFWTNGCENAVTPNGSSFARPEPRARTENLRPSARQEPRTPICADRTSPGSVSLPASIRLAWYARQEPRTPICTVRRSPGSASLPASIRLACFARQEPRSPICTVRGSPGSAGLPASIRLACFARREPRTPVKKTSCHPPPEGERGGVMGVFANSITWGRFLMR
jgi:hypothetical protein